MSSCHRYDLLAIPTDAWDLRPAMKLTSGLVDGNKFRIDYCINVTDVPFDAFLFFIFGCYPEGTNPKTGNLSTVATLIMNSDTYDTVDMCKNKIPAETDAFLVSGKKNPIKFAITFYAYV